MTTAAPFRPHVLVVGPACVECSILYDRHCERDGDRHRWRFTVECPGLPAGQCESYLECDTPGCPLHYIDGDVETKDRLVDEGDGEVDYHDVTHVQMGSMWCVPTGQCGIATYDSLKDAAETVLDLGPGRHLVQIDGGGWDADEGMWLVTWEPPL